MLKSCGIVLVGKKIITTDSNNWCLLVLSCLGSTTFNNNSNIRQQKPSGCLCPEIRYPPLNWYISKGVASARNMKLVWSHASTDIDKARLLAAASPHSGDSLAAPPITSVGLRYQLLTDWVAKRANHTHAAVEKWWAHVGLSEKRPRQQRHLHLNDIIWCAMKRAKISLVNKSVGLLRQDSKRPDGITILLFWHRLYRPNSKMEISKQPDDSPANPSLDTLQKLQQKHPPASDGIADLPAPQRDTA